MSETAQRRLVAFFFFASGFAALIYQVVWSRAAALVIGNTTAAAGTVVAVFMAGLALGSHLAGRFAARRASSGRLHDLVRLYGLLELAIGLFGALVPLLFRALEPAFAALYPFPALFAAARVILVALVLLPPTLLMGATLPLLVQHFAAGRDPAHAAGLLYAVNSLGAAVGAFAAGFLLIPAAGLVGAALAAVAVNLAVGAAAFLVGRPSAPPAPPAPPAPIPRAGKIAIAAYALSGFAALTYEIAWTRSITLAIGSTVHAFTLILAGFIGGLAFGSWYGGRRARRIADPLAAIAVVQVLIAIWATALVWLLERLPMAMVGLVAAYAGRFALLQAAQFAVILLCVLAPCALMGALLPIVMSAVAPKACDAGRGAGRVVAWNTLLCIAGSLAASFLLLPRLGVDWTMRVAIFVNLAAAILAGRAARLDAIRAGLLAGACVLLACAAIVRPAWDLRIAASGPYVYAGPIQKAARDAGGSLAEGMLARNHVVAAYWDGYGLVTVTGVGDGDLALRVNGKGDASTGHSDMCTQVLLGQIPMVLHAGPRDVLVIGLGSGVSASQLLSYPVASVECVEISPAVARGAAHFHVANHGVLANPRFRLTLNDGRAHLKFAPRDYDVIVSEPSNLWVSGMASLYTREFFRDAKARLRPGGLFAQWIHAYKLSVDDLRAVVRTLRDVFQEVWLWETYPGGDYLLMGLPDARRPAYAEVARRIRETALSPDVRALGLDETADLLACFVLDSEGTRAFGGDARPLTDDDCWVEYTAPRSMYADHRREIVERIDPLRRSAAAILADGPPEAIRALDAAVAGRRHLARALTAAGNRLYAERAEEVDRAAAARPDDGWTRRFAAELGEEALKAAIGKLAAGQVAHALAALEGLPRSWPGYAGARSEAGMRLSGLGAQAEAVRQFREALRARPDLMAALYGLPQSLLFAGMLDEALRECDAALARDPRTTALVVLRGRILLRRGDVSGARAQWEAARQMDPSHRDVSAFERELAKALRPR